MANLEDILKEFIDNKSQKPKSMWPEPNLLAQQETKGTGPLGIVGTLAKLGSTVASIVPGPHQAVTIPLALGGAALEGADKGGIAGAVKGAGFEGVKQVGTAGLGSLAEGLKAPAEVAKVSAFSSQGSPITVPGVRANPVEAFSSKGNPLTIPASPRTVGGS